MMFLEFWVRKTEAEERDHDWYVLNRALGTLWERSDFEPREKSYKSKQLDRVWYPLSILLAQTDLQKAIKKDFTQNGQQIGGGEYNISEGEEVVNLAQETTKEQFLEFLKNAGGVLPGMNPPTEKK